MDKLRLVIVVVGLVYGRRAVADGDNRPQDRFYFGLHSGIANYSESIADMPALTDPATALGLESSYWPSDYFGFGWGYDVALLSGAETTGLGAYMVGAVPLRYVQLYAGGWAGLRHRMLGDTGEIDPLFHPVIGMNGYINRNTRLFVQVQGVDLDADTAEQAQLITLGVRWSPDVFHRLRGADKFNTLWLTTLTTVAAFVLTKRSLGGDWL